MVVRRLQIKGVKYDCLKPEVTISAHKESKVLKDSQSDSRKGRPFRSQNYLDLKILRLKIHCTFKDCLQTNTAFIVHSKC